MADRHALLLGLADEFARVTLTNVRREYPRDFRMELPRPIPLPSRPRELNPAFYGCYDWHSAVEMHWALVRLLRAVPEHVPRAESRARLDEHLTPERVAVEAAYFETHPGSSGPTAGAGR